MKFARFLGLLFAASLIATFPLHAAATGHFERTLQVSGSVDLDVTSGSGNITVHQGGAGSVAISAKIHSSNSSWLFGSGDVEERIRRIEKNPPIEQQGNSIRLGRFEDREITRNISIDYDVTVPASTRVTAQTGSGDQSISGVQLAVNAKAGSGNINVENLGGEAHVSTGSGDVKASSVKGSVVANAGSGNITAKDLGGEVFVNTGSGNVEVHQSAAGDVKAETGSGNIRLYNIKGGLRASAGSGDIHAEGEATHDWRVGAGSGNVTLRLPSNASFNLDARTASGSLRVKPAVTMQGNIDKRHIQGKVGNGGVILDVHTGSGDIEID
jgi:DUF4097 and DUF4098 domain-containing protein YvlB